MVIIAWPIAPQNWSSRVRGRLRKKKKNCLVSLINVVSPRFNKFLHESPYLESPGRTCPFLKCCRNTLGNGWFNMIQPPTRFCASAWGGVLDHASDWDALPTSWHFITGMAQIPHTDVVAAWQWLLRVNLHRETWYFCSFDEGQFWPIYSFYSWKDSAEPNSKTFHLQCCSNLHELVVFPSCDYHINYHDSLN